jgi:hypothetical protein
MVLFPSSCHTPNHFPTLSRALQPHVETSPNVRKVDSKRYQADRKGQHDTNATGAFLVRRSSAIDSDASHYMGHQHELLCTTVARKENLPS